MGAPPSPSSPSGWWGWGVARRGASGLACQVSEGRWRGCAQFHAMSPVTTLRGAAAGWRPLQPGVSRDKGMAVSCPPPGRPEIECENKQIVFTSQESLTSTLHNTLCHPG